MNTAVYDARSTGPTPHNVPLSRRSAATSSPRINEDEREGLLGEVEGLKVSLVGAEDELTQLDRRASTDEAITLGMPRIAPAHPKTGGAEQHEQ
jgi:hypothetical protein